ncbi:uncharacterized protein LOC123542251 isoform X4 [Mercenaria mercenaria]|uniref:uncharacterized protein LOC123542251 isoform X4 n=1 Tax=Mercenaria mercenaria TaxID=6596 RepID=UPI00234F1415|nr:uncharacterized protein LOC123542251 isoform X4 [Mercenaria mercenaria]
MKCYNRNRKMNSYVARNIFNELQDSVQRFCRCPRCAKFCAASGTAVLIPTAFWLQLTALVPDQWAYNDCFNNDMAIANCTSFYLSVLDTDLPWYEESRCLRVLEITSVILMGLLMIVGFGVCCRTCCRSITVESCKICYVCILSLLSLIPVIGSAILVISLASVCGYVCVKTFELREDYEIQAGSDECEREGEEASLLSTN